MDTATVAGLVATTPRYVETIDGKRILSFRLACPQKGYDRDTGERVTKDTNWYTVLCFDDLASDSADRVGKGNRIVVVGNLMKVTDWSADSPSGTSVEIHAHTLGNLGKNIS
jgi:single-strand DNA-binding protein